MKCLLGCHNICRFQIIFAIVCMFVLFSLSASVTSASLAITTSTLPADIYSPGVRYGYVNGLDQRFGNSGTLKSLTDINSIEFDAKTLSKFNSKANDLIATLNRFGAFKLGNALSLGVLEIKSKPSVDYTAPLLAKGITKRWTLAVGAPVIHYQNQVSLSQSFSNIGYYKEQFSGLSPDLDAALNTNLAESTQQVLQDRGYRRLENREEKFLGDVQVVSLYRLYDSADSNVIYQTTVSLPTGPKYDTNDLQALNTFHKSAIENQFSYSRFVSPLWKVTPYASFKYTLPEKVDMRVPNDEDDILPDQTTIENVDRKDGLSYEIGLQNTYDISDSFQASLDYRLGTKDADDFSGSRGARYDLLSRETRSKWQKIVVELAYSSVKSYFKNSAGIPFIVSLDYFDTLAGENIERRFGQEISLTLFF